MNQKRKYDQPDGITRVASSVRLSLVEHTALGFSSQVFVRQFIEQSRWSAQRRRIGKGVKENLETLTTDRDL